MLNYSMYFWQPFDFWMVLVDEVVFLHLSIFILIFEEFIEVISYYTGNENEIFYYVLALSFPPLFLCFARYVKIQSG